MNKIFTYNQYITESDSNDITNDSLDESKFTELSSEISDMIKASLKTDDDKTFNDFIDAYLKNPDETQIEGLINDSDIYDFYLKYRNDIDDVLLDIKFYDEKPSEMKVYSLYEYIIKGTKKSISEIISTLK